MNAKLHHKVIQGLRYFGNVSHYLTAAEEPFLSLNRYLARWIISHPRSWHVEGFVSPWEAARICELIIETRGWQVAQIGFNGGHSALAILSADPQVSLVSFDLGEHRYATAAERYIAERFRGRHDLVWGDSAVTVPDYVKAHPEASFDLVFVDGGHTYDAASTDLHNCRRLCKPDGLVIMDDLTPEHDYGVGPTQAWEQATRTGLVQELNRFVGPPKDGRVFAIGRYSSSY